MALFPFQPLQVACYTGGIQFSLATRVKQEKVVSYLETIGKAAASKQCFSFRMVFHLRLGRVRFQLDAYDSFVLNIIVNDHRRRHSYSYT